MTEKQRQAFERSDARRAAKGLSPVPAPVSVQAPSATSTRASSPGCSPCRAAKAERSLANKLATAALAEPEVTPEVLAARRGICAACPHSKKFLKRLLDVSQCELCSCFINWKTRLADERCPVDKWPSVSTHRTNHEE